MRGSRTIQVLKRNGKAEEFDELKLACAFWRAMGGRRESRPVAVHLSQAVRFYLSREQHSCISSAAIFEMCVKVLVHAELLEAASMLQAHWSWRQGRRRELRVRHDFGKVTLWDKSWLADFAQRSWRLSRRSARILAEQVETDLLKDGPQEVARDEVIARLNDAVSAYGLADAVPVSR